MLDQHTAVRKDLQDCHLLMDISINTYTKCATNHILYQTTEAIAKAHGPGVTNDTPPPSANCRTVLGLGNRRLVEGDDEEGVNEIMFDLSPGYRGVSGEFEDIEAKEDETQGT